MTIHTPARRAVWTLGGVAAAILVGATMGFKLADSNGGPFFSADIPVRTAPAVKGRLVAELAAPPMVPGQGRADGALNRE